MKIKVTYNLMGNYYSNDNIVRVVEAPSIDWVRRYFYHYFSEEVKNSMLTVIGIEEASNAN